MRKSRREAGQEKQKSEAQSRRNCWRVARSVSPDISPRFGLSGLR